MSLMGMEKGLLTGPEGAEFAAVIPTKGAQLLSGPFGVEAQKAGRDVLELICEALQKQTDEKRVRALAECVRMFPKETLRCPEVCDYLEWLAKNRRTQAIDRILRDRPVRGRPMRSAEAFFAETAILHGIMEREDCSAAKAATIARREHKCLQHKSVQALQNDFSPERRQQYRLFKQVRWISKDELSEHEWRRPQDRDALEGEKS
jgi:hypothetical protein